MKNLFIGLLIITVFQTHAQTYTGIVDPNYRGAILYDLPNFQGQAVPLYNIGQTVLRNAKSIQVFGGYQVEVNISGNTSYITQDVSNITNSSTERPYTLRAHNQFYPAVLYSGPNQTGIAWYIPLNSTFRSTTPGWSNHFPNGYPQSIYVKSNYELKYLVNGQNDYVYKCGGVVNLPQGFREVQISANNCANSSQTNNNPPQNPTQHVTFYGGPNQTGVSTILNPGTYTANALTAVPASIRSLDIPSGFAVRIKIYKPLPFQKKSVKCYRYTGRPTLSTPIGLGTGEKIIEIMICGPNATSYNCRCN